MWENTVKLAGNWCKAHRRKIPTSVNNSEVISACAYFESAEWGMKQRPSASRTRCRTRIKKRLLVSGWPMLIMEAPWSLSL